MWVCAGSKRLGDRASFGRGDAADRGELGERHEPAQTHIHDEASAIGFHHLGLDDLASLVKLDHPAPLTPASRAAGGEDDAAVGTFGLTDRRDDRVADCDIGSFCARFTKGKNASRAAAEINEGLVAAYRGDDTLYDLAGAKRTERVLVLLDAGEELFHRLRLGRFALRYASRGPCPPPPSPPRPPPPLPGPARRGASGAPRLRFANRAQLVG